MDSEDDELRKWIRKLLKIEMDRVYGRFLTDFKQKSKFSIRPYVCV